jgi:guanosine-3',5'-bis(diphosphate) 3'-pyrophosphohydrolase
MHNDLKNDGYVTRLRDKLLDIDTEQKLDFAQIDKAIYRAKKYHAGQMRKSGEPFYTHPLEVAYIICDYLLKTDVIVTSILHDIVEDTEVTVEMITAEFGTRIAEMVDRLTRDRPDGSKLSVEEIVNNAYAAGDKEVLMIKLIDRLHNIQTIGSMKIEKQKEIAEETLKYLAIISTEFDDINLEEYIYMGSYKIIANKQDYNFYYKKYRSFLSFNDYILPSPTFENN